MLHNAVSSSRGGSVGCFDPRPCARGDLMADHNRISAVVSIHAPARGATRAQSHLHASKRFRSTPLREGRLEQQFHATSNVEFRSTPLREGRPGLFSTVFNQLGFRSTPLREGRRAGQITVLGKGGFRSTPLREGRRLRRHQQDVHLSVSIHAPARGATRVLQPCMRNCPSFDPRPCARGDVNGVRQPVLGIVSIHAPARGATS